MEIFRDIPDYEGLYQVSNLGNIKSLSRWRNNRYSGYVSKVYIKKCYLDKNYLKVNLCKNNSKSILVHKLVAMAFLDHKPNGHKLVVDHINGNKTDNRVENLRLITQRKNCYTHYKGTSKYKGVSWRSNRNIWIAQIYVNGKRKYLGSSKNEIDVNNMYQNALKQINNA